MKWFSLGVTVTHTLGEAQFAALVAVIERIDRRHIAAIITLTKEMIKMSEALDILRASVTRIEDRGDATITLLTGLAEQVRQNAEDPIAIRALADKLDAQAGEFEAAIAANTPPAPAPDPVADPAPEV